MRSEWPGQKSHLDPPCDLAWPLISSGMFVDTEHISMSSRVRSRVPFDGADVLTYIVLTTSRGAPDSGLDRDEGSHAVSTKLLQLYACNIHCHTCVR